MVFLFVLGDVEGDDEVLLCLVEVECGSWILVGSDVDCVWIFFGWLFGRFLEMFDVLNNLEELLLIFLVFDVDGKDMILFIVLDERCFLGLI